MKPHRRPPADITPEQFFTGWLPAEIARLGSAGGVPDMVVAIELTGEGGGCWDLVTREGQLEVMPSGTRHDHLVRLKLSVQDWRAIAVGEPGPVDLTPPEASPTDLLFVDSASQQLLASIDGTFRFEVHDYNGRTWTLWATFGDQGAVDPPTAVISTDARTYAAILAREIAAPEAYFAQKISITGDVGQGMQVGLALLPKL